MPHQHAQEHAKHLEHNFISERKHADLNDLKASILHAVPENAAIGATMAINTPARYFRHDAKHHANPAQSGCISLKYHFAKSGVMNMSRCNTTPNLAAAMAAAPKAILFDLDDTLWPIVPVIVQAERSLHRWLALHAPKVAQQFDIETLRAHRLLLLAQQPHLKLDLGALRRAGLQQAFASAGEDSSRIEAAMAHFFAARNAVTLYADVLPGLDRLKEKMLLGSISNGNADLEVIGLGRHFTVSLAAAEFGCAKPDAAIFHAACDALKVAPHEAMYVGDDLLLDVDGAQKAGLRAVWLNRTGSCADQHTGIVPDFICSNLEQLLLWLGI